MDIAEKVVVGAKTVSVEDVVGAEVGDQVDAALKKFGPDAISDEQFVALVTSGKLSSFALEKTIGDSTRAVCIRRMIIGIVWVALI
jgi:hypothetical protein